MEEAQEILLSSLETSGISLPTGVSSIEDLTPDALVSICAQSLHLIDDLSSFPTSLPVSMAERFKICTEIASAVKNLGYRGDLSFHQFLYPSDEDSYKLVRFLVEKLSRASESRKVTCKKATTTRSMGNEEIRDEVRRTLEEWTKGDDDLGEGQSYQEGLSREFGKSKRDESVGRESSVQGNDTYISELEQKLALLLEQSSKIRCEVEDSRRQEAMLMEEVATWDSEGQLLDNELALLKTAAEMAFDDQHPVGFYIEDLNNQVEARRNNLVDLESQWDSIKRPLAEKKRSLEQSLHGHKSKVQEEHLRMKEIELETKATKSELLKRDEECSQLLSKLENQPKIASRKSYIQRITEITKNSRKQDADIERIKQETRDLQIESNTIQDRLHRTYAVVEETVFRDAKKDPVRRQACKLLTTIHESFMQISDGILATDRAQREAAEQEAKLEATASRNLDIDKLQADLAAIRRENEFLEQQIKHD